MIEKNVKFKKLDVDLEHFTISIAFVSIITENEEELTRTALHRKAFVPGQIDEVKEATGLDDNDLNIKYLKELWSDDVIQNYRDSLEDIL